METVGLSGGGVVNEAFEADIELDMTSRRGVDPEDGDDGQSANQTSSGGGAGGAGSGKLYVKQKSSLSSRQPTSAVPVTVDCLPRSNSTFVQFSVPRPSRDSDRSRRKSTSEVDSPRTSSTSTSCPALSPWVAPVGGKVSADHRGSSSSQSAALRHRSSIPDRKRSSTIVVISDVPDGDDGQKSVCIQERARSSSTSGYLNLWVAQTERRCSGTSGHLSQGVTQQPEDPFQAWNGRVATHRHHHRRLHQDVGESDEEELEEEPIEMEPDGVEVDICDVDLERDPMNDRDDEMVLSGSSSEDSEATDDGKSVKAGRLGRLVTRCCAGPRRYWHCMKNEFDDVIDDVKPRLKKAKCQPGRDCCTLQTLRRMVPIVDWAPRYRLMDLQGDLMAGFTVGLTVIPQSIAYASLAKLPPEYGLYSAFIGSFLYAIFGPAKDITLGPSALQSLLVATYARSPVDGDATFAILLALFSGFILLGFHFIRFGAIFDFVSFPVIKAFTTAAAITIAVSQIKPWFGLVGDVPDGVIGNLGFIFSKLSTTRLWDFLLGCVCIFFIVLFRKLKELKWKKRYRELPLKWKIVKKSLWFIGTARNVIVIIGASVVVYIFSASGLHPFTVTKHMPAGIPAFQVPAFTINTTNVTMSFAEISQSLGAGFIILPILAILEAMSIGKPFARKGRYKFDTNQELLPYGLANVVGAFCQGIPVTGTFSRTALNAASGVRTPGGGIVTGVIVLLALAFATPVFVYIPQAALAVVIILAVIDTMTFHKVYVFWKTNKIDLLPWFVTFISSLVIGIAFGVFIGIGVSLVILLYPTFRPKSKFVDLEVNNQLDEKTLLMTLNNGLTFPAVEHFKDTVLKRTVSTNNDVSPGSVIVDCSMISAIDSSTIQSTRELLEDLHMKKIPLVFCNLQSQPTRVFNRAHPQHMLCAADIADARDLITVIQSVIEEKRMSCISASDVAAAAAATTTTTTTTADNPESPDHVNHVNLQSVDDPVSSVSLQLGVHC